MDEQLRADRTQVATVPIMVAQPDEIMYEVELGADEPDKGLDAQPIPPPIPDEFFYFVTLWLNDFLVKSGVYDTFSPREILLRWKMDAKKNCR